MQDSIAEVKSPVSVSFQEHQAPIHESLPTAVHPDMKGRATPLEDSPMTESQKQDLRNIFGKMGNQESAENLLANAGINAPVKSTETISAGVTKKQGFFAQIWETIKNFFRNLFR
jgi:hypothetical protein